MAKQEISGVTPTGIAVALAVVVALGFLFLGPSLFSPLESAPSSASPATLSDNQGQLMITDIVEGTGAEALPGTNVTVHYVGTLENGQVFDSSVARGEPFVFPLGAGMVIQGWEQGVAGMKVGGKRRLVIPPELGYGAQAVGTIPANSTLIFEVELLDVQSSQ
jgi:FKBP-type peptidyl-prolyl cis-trans isomerase